ncbi:MAG TPA: hypothetical protein PK765_03825 [bacterium]|nr:hypothetical protein [bacterium]
MRDSNILLVNQVFSFYLYGRDFSNQLSAPLFFGPDEFARYLRDHRIDAVATSNKNNLYADYGTTEDSIYTSTHDSNDESVLFCDETPRSDVVSLSIKYQIDRDADTMVNFGINDFESATLLDNHHEAVILLDQPTDVRNTCITIFDTPTESLDRERKTVHISAIQYTLADGTSLSGTPSDYRFQDFPIETRWLKTL